MEIRIIKQGLTNIDFYGHLEPAMFEVWMSNDPLKVIVTNDLLIQIKLGERVFVILANHWQQFLDFNRTFLWATEITLDETTG